MCRFRSLCSLDLAGFSDRLLGNGRVFVARNPLLDKGNGKNVLPFPARKLARLPDARHKICDDGHIYDQHADLPGRNMSAQLVNLKWNEAAGGDDCEVFRPTLA